MFDRASLLRVHRDLLERWRGRMNLVGPGPLDSHYDDAAAALDGLQPQGHWVDLGTGAGFPGVVFAATFPAVRVDLVDSRQKRCIFLEEVLGRSGAGGLQVHCTRLENLDHRYDGVMARALAAPQQMVVHARDLLRPDGMLLLFLQEDGEVPAPTDFEVAHDVRYLVNHRSRRCVGLRYRPAAS